MSDADVIDTFDLHIHPGGRRPQELAKADVIIRLADFAFRHGLDKLSLEPVKARYSQDKLLSEALGPFGFCLFGEDGAVLAHTDTALASFEMAQRVALTLLQSGMRLGGESVASIKLLTADGVLLTAVFTHPVTPSTPRPLSA